MSIAKMIRWSGLTVVLAGLLYALGAVVHPVGEDLAAIRDPSWVPAHLVYWVSIVLLHFGLVGLFAQQAGKAGWLGVVGFVLAFAGTALVGSIVLVAATLMPLIAEEAPAIFEQATTLPDFLVLVFVLGFGLGYVLFGAATMRAGVLPRWSGLLVVMGVTLFVISEAGPLEGATAHALVTSGDILFGLGLVWMGYTVWRKREPRKVGDSYKGVAQWRSE